MNYKYANISFAFDQSKTSIYAHHTNPCFAVFCKFLGVFWDVWEEIVFLKG